MAKKFERSVNWEISPKCNKVKLNFLGKLKNVKLGANNFVANINIRSIILVKTNREMLSR